MNLQHLPSWLSIIIDWVTNAWNFSVGIAMTLIAQLIPIKNIVHLVLFFFILDVFIGIWKARKIDKLKFNPRVVWEKTAPRVLFSVTLIVILFMWDTVYKQEFIRSYNIAGWFISGLLIASIVENMYKITGWDFFKKFGIFVNKKIEDKGLKSDDNDKIEE